MSREVIAACFPSLRYEVTSPEDTSYNCVAWAAGDGTRWWWPVNSSDAFWPQGAPRIPNLASFVAAFGALGYEPCDADGPERGFEKVAIYVRDNTPTHMARQLSSGEWTSKLGEQEDIVHHRLRDLEGPTYGNVAQVLRRRSRSDKSAKTVLR